MDQAPFALTEYQASVKRILDLPSSAILPPPPPRLGMMCLLEPRQLMRNISLVFYCWAEDLKGAPTHEGVFPHDLSLCVSTDEGTGRWEA